MYYQYITPDWEENNGGYTGRQTRFRIKEYDTSGEAIRETDKNYYNGFARSQNNAAIKLINDDGKPYSGDLQMSAWAVDNESSKTPKIRMRFYGAAAMYKKYRVQVIQPGSMTYKVGASSNISRVPLTVKLESGADDVFNHSSDRIFWANPDEKLTNIVFTIDNGEIITSGSAANPTQVIDKWGDVTGYTINIDPGKSEDRTTLNYPADFISYLNQNKGRKLSNEVDFTTTNVEAEIEKVNSNLAVIPYDKYFISWIDEKQKKVIDEGTGYYQKLQITPKVSYNEVNVRITTPEGVPEDTKADFNDRRLETGKALTFHAGDMLDLSGQVDNKNYRVVGYQYTTDDGETWDEIQSTETLLLLPDRDYKIRLAVEENNNKIEIIGDVEDIENNLITASDLNKFRSEEPELAKALEGKNVLKLDPNASTLADMIKPQKGAIYPIKYKGEGNGDSGVTDDKADYTHTYYTFRQGYDTDVCIGYTYHMIAKTNVGDNVIYVDKDTETRSKTPIYEKQQVEETYYERTGLFGREKKTRTVEKDVVVGYEYDKSKYSYDLSGKITTKYRPIRNKGYYDTKTEPAQGYGVSTTSWLKDGEDMGASAVTGEDGTFKLEGLDKINRSLLFFNLDSYRTVLISDGFGNETVKKINLDKSSASTVEFPYPKSAPYVSQLTYSYGNSNNNAEQGNSKNQITILDDELTLNAVINGNGHNVKKAVFTVTTSGGITSTYDAYPTESNSLVYSCKIPKMTENLFSGDTMTVHLVDSDTNVNYPDVDTGITFYTAYSQKVPQSFDFTDTPAVNIPLIGSAIGQGRSGVLNFGKTEWPNGTGYTIQINADTVLGGMAQKTSGEKYQAYQKFHEKAKNAVDTQSNAGYVLRSEFPDGPPQIKDYTSDEDYAAAWDKYTKNMNDASNPMAGFNNQNQSVEIALVIAFDFVKMEDGSYMFACGTVAVGGAFTFNMTMYTMAIVVPVFLNIQAILQADVVISYVTGDGRNAYKAGEFDAWEGNIAERLSASGNQVTLKVVISGKAQVGAGMCGILSARGYVQLKVEFDLAFEGFDWGALIYACGGIGFDLIVLSMNINIAEYTVGWGLLEKAGKADFFNGLMSVDDKDSALTAHEYGMGSADMSAFGNNGGVELMSIPKAVKTNTLMDNAAERTRPQIIPIDDTRKFIVFVGNGTELDTSERDGANAATLFYSVYDGTEWSKPEPVADDGTVDSAPVIMKVNDRVVIAWSDANAAFTEGETNKSKLRKMGISSAAYFFDENRMSSEKNLVNDKFFNLKPQINAENTDDDGNERELTKDEFKNIIRGVDPNISFSKAMVTVGFKIYNGNIAKTTAQIKAKNAETGTDENITEPVTKNLNGEEEEPTPTPTPGRSGGGGGGGSLRTRATASPKPSDAPDGTAAPEETLSPDAAAKPADSGNWFTDVPQSAWYYEPVKYAFDNGLMSGVSDTEFAPELDITRGMFVTVLHRLDKETVPKAKTAFSDVPDGTYYANAVAWANENGIVEGYSDTEFAPEDKITREQLAAIIYRYAKYKGEEGMVGQWMFLLDFADREDISEYAYEALCWNTIEGLIEGFEDNTLRPKANTTRAQAAAILERFIERDSGSSDDEEQSFEIAPLEGEPSDYS